MTKLKELKVVFQKLDTEESIKNWNNKKLQVGLIHPASAGHGLNLQSGGSTIVWFGLTWSLELYQQTVARLWHIVTCGTIDEHIMRNLKDKDKTQAALIDAVKAELGR